MRIILNLHLLITLCISYILGKYFSCTSQRYFSCTSHTFNLGTISKDKLLLISLLHHLEYIASPFEAPPFYAVYDVKYYPLSFYNSNQNCEEIEENVLLFLLNESIIRYMSYLFTHKGRQ